MPISEDELILASQAGDAQAFGELYSAYVKRISTFVFYKTSSREITEDLTSIIFIKALKNISSYQKTANGSFAGWLYRIARHTIIDYYRTRHPSSNLDEAVTLPQPSRLAEHTDAKLALAKVKTYLDSLPELQRDIITMRVWQELPYAVIAESLGKSEASCKMLYSRAIRSLRQSLEQSIVTLALLIIAIIR